jgi:hypothetical protein
MRTRRWIAGAVGLLFVVASLAVALAQAPPTAALPPKCPPVCVDPPDPPLLAPGVPQAVQAQAGDALATVAWSPPDLRAHLVENYTVTPYVGDVPQPGKAATVAVTSTTVRGLSNGVTYTFRVVANGAGASSAPSSPSNAVIPTAGIEAGGTPSAPYDVKASAHDRAVTVRWSHSLRGWVLIDRYRVDTYLDGRLLSSQYTLDRTVSSTQVTDLWNGAFYEFTVAPVLADGTVLPASERSNLVRPMRAVGPVIDLRAAPAARRVTVSWTRPGDLSAEEIDSYVLTVWEGRTYRRALETTATEVPVTDLTPGVAYTFTVVAWRKPVEYGPSVNEGPSSQVVGRALFGHSATQAYVYGAFIDFLDRAPSGGEMALWTAGLEAGTARYTFTSGLAQSDEWIGVIVDRFYRDTLGRGPDAGGRAHWVGILRSGQMTVAQVAGQFYGSAEYFQATGRGNLATWVRDLYSKLLKRTADTGGVAYWMGEAQRRGLPFVATAMYQSDETLGVRVESLYDVLLGRPADAGGKEFWKKQLLASGDIVLALNLAASAEYFDLAGQVYA